MFLSSAHQKGLLHSIKFIAIGTACAAHGTGAWGRYIYTCWVQLSTPSLTTDDAVYWILAAHSCLNLSCVSDDICNTTKNQQVDSKSCFFSQTESITSLQWGSLIHSPLRISPLLSLPAPDWEQHCEELPVDSPSVKHASSRETHIPDMGSYLPWKNKSEKRGRGWRGVWKWNMLSVALISILILCVVNTSATHTPINP